MAKAKTVVNEEELEQDLPETEEEDYEEEEQEEEELEEGSEAADTLKPGSKSFPDPKSKIEVMKAVIGAIASASSDELTKWNDQALALIGHEADKIPDGAASHNKDSIDAKPSAAVGEAVRADLKTVFDTDKTLTEEAKERLETIFEAAVTARILIEREEMEEQYVQQMDESIQEVKQEIEEQLNSYISYCAENWMKDNEVAIESTLRSELAEEFIEGLRDLFTEHFIEIPENKADVIEALTEKVAELEEVLTQAIEENNELKGVNVESELSDALEEVAEGLTVSQTEKLAALCEDVEFDGDIESFKKKVGIIKETYFTGGNSQASEKEPDDFEKADNELNEETVVINDPVMRRYAAKISQTVKDDLR